ncbi:unnamed protein product [Trichogramma brassicae]|uniref:Uncharacterized protein n=1 Tax=Trichogramma brassicae TaxID=86971 RepID=A0A6H5ILL6_9HYME|nr:unnamed protein product [Trichogramma brassicae]
MIYMHHFLIERSSPSSGEKTCRTKIVSEPLNCQIQTKIRIQKNNIINNNNSNINLNIMSINRKNHSKELKKRLSNRLPNFFQMVNPIGNFHHLPNHAKNKIKTRNNSYDNITPGNQVHWRSYNRANEQQTQYQEPEVARHVQRRPSSRRAPQQAQQQQPQAAQPQPQYQQNPGFLGNVNYNPIEKAPPSIQEILQYQAQIPYIDIVPEKTRIEALEAAKAQAAKFAEDYPKQVLAQRPPQVIIEEAPRNQYRPKPRPRERRQTAQYQAQQDEVVYYEPQEYTVPSQEERSEHQRRQASYYETPASQEQSHLIQAHEPSAGRILRSKI